MSLRYAGSFMLALLTVLTVLGVLQSFVVNRQFQLNAGANSGSAGVLNLGNQSNLGGQITIMPDRAAVQHTPPLPNDTELARVQAPDVPPPSMGLPAFKPVFSVAAAQNVPEPQAAPAATPAANGAAPQQVLAVGDIVLVERVEPKFPTQALRQGIETGSVTVKFTVQTDGSVLNPVVLTATPRRGIFDDAALHAVLRWKFKPLAAPEDTTVIVEFSPGGG